jgi:hypothetical protein
MKILHLREVVVETYEHLIKVFEVFTENSWNEFMYHIVAPFKRVEKLSSEPEANEESHVLNAGYFIQRTLRSAVKSHGRLLACSINSPKVGTNLFIMKKPTEVGFPCIFLID